MVGAAHRTTKGETAVGTSRRALILRDSLTFLVLALVTLTLFGVTLFLFHSFENRRESLAGDFVDEGRAELSGGKPKDAVVSLRAALSYKPDDYQTQLLLAHALADAGETDQATNYYLNLRAGQPGDGFLNWQLARLERKKGFRTDAIGYYRASIFGDWRGDGSVRRRDVRLELVDYLMEAKDYPAARAELLIAAGNAPDSLEFNLLFANKLQAAGDSGDAMTYYNKAIVNDPHSVVALEAAGRLMYDDGKFAQASKLLRQAVEDSPKPSPELLQEARDSERIQELTISRELPARMRAQHLLAATQIAQERYTACFVNGHEGMTSSTYGPEHVRMLDEIGKGWAAAKDSAARQKMVQTEAGQDDLAKLTMETELVASDDPMAHPQFSCGPPQGDDALLLTLAKGWKPDGESR